MEMPKWEYKVVSLRRTWGFRTLWVESRGNRATGSRYLWQNVYEMLLQLGDNGWELISVFTPNRTAFQLLLGTHATVWTFKRPKAE
jgi:hypothetical protein